MEVIVPGLARPLASSAAVFVARPFIGDADGHTGHLLCSKDPKRGRLCLVAERVAGHSDAGRRDRDNELAL